MCRPTRWTFGDVSRHYSVLKMRRESRGVNQSFLYSSGVQGPTKLAGVMESARLFASDSIPTVRELPRRMFHDSHTSPIP